MFKPWKIVLMVACVGLIIGLAIWLPGLLNDPGQILVGDWHAESAPPRFESKWQSNSGQVPEDLKNLSEDVAKELGPKLRSAERFTFGHNGEYSSVRELLGLKISTEGTWKARPGQGDQVLVTVHTKKLKILDPKGETTEKEQDRLAEWVVSRSGGDHLNVSISDAEGSKGQCKLWRAKN